MDTAPTINPVAFTVAGLQVHWYGLMYLVGFLAGWGLGWWRAPRFGWRREEIADLVFYIAMGVIIGGRLGYVFFYKPGEFMANPLFVFAIQQGGMSFHGGLLGVLVAMLFYGRKTGRTFFAVTDFIAPLIPPGLFAGRIGNFLNGELWGAPSNVPWALVFPRVDNQARHPSQLYEAALEGVVLFILLWAFAARPRPVMAVSGVFLCAYGAFRFAVEFVREPDAHLGYLAFDWLTMGHVLSAPMVVVGVALLGIAYHRGTLAPLSPPAPAAPAVTDEARQPRRRKRRRNRG